MKSLACLPACQGLAESSALVMAAVMQWPHYSLTWKNYSVININKWGFFVEVSVLRETCTLFLSLIN